MSETAKLPGLSKMAEADLREQYTKELGKEVPAELTTRQGLIDAIHAHRGAPVDTPEPTTALDAIQGDGGEVVGDEASEVPSTQEYTARTLDIEHFTGFLRDLSEENLERVLEAVVAVSHERGIVTTDAPEDVVATEAPAIDADAVPEGHIRVTNKVTKLSQDLPLKTWDALGAAGQKDFTEQVAKPKELD